jgi:hypothetical protein
MIFTKSFTGNAATATHGGQGTGGTAGVAATDGIVLNESI